MDKIRKMRLRAEMTQAQLAERLSVALITVQKWEDDGESGRTPTIKHLRDIAKVLGCKPADLL